MKQSKTQKYNQTFYKKHHDKILEKKICIYCGGKYNYYTKSQHSKSLKCIKARDGEEAYKQAKINRITGN